MKPVIHYDHIMGVSPQWRSAITSALKGHPVALRLEQLMLSGFTPAGARTLTACYEYAKAGQQVYCIGPKLQELLRLTDMKAVPAQFLQLPYRCIYVAFVDSPFLMWGDERTEWHELSGIYVTQTGRTFTFVFWGKENEKAKCAGDDATYWCNLDLDKCDPVKDNEAALDVESYLRSLFADTSQDNSDPGVVLPEGCRDRQNETVLACIQVVLNMILYLNSLDPDVTEVARTNSGKRKRLQTKLKKARRTRQQRKLKDQLAAMSEAKVKWIGKGIELGQAAPRKATRRKGNGPARKPHWRKGHFHTYWTGPRTAADGSPQKGTNQVLKWIPPIFIGDMADLVATRGTVHKFRQDHV